MEEMLVEKRQEVVDVASIAGGSQVLVMLSDFRKDAWADTISLFYLCKSKPLETGEAFWEILLPSEEFLIAF